jgi:uncharacterized phage protein (TIGR01671 family)
MTNRIIKFRIWNEKDNCFIYSEPYNPNLPSGGGYDKDKKCYYVFWPDANIHGESCKIKNCNLTDKVIQQFTGLLDKNGVEIYEGDLVTLGTKEIWRIDWYNHFASFEKNGLTKNQEGYDMSDFAEVTEVIGNIFENPELLK